VVLGIAMVVEALFLLWLGWRYADLASNNDGLFTFSFLTLLYFAAFSIVSARERHWFWATKPHPVFVAAVAGEVLAGTLLTFVGLPGLVPLPLGGILAIGAYAAFCCLVVNDALKIALLRLNHGITKTGKEPINLVSLGDQKP